MGCGSSKSGEVIVNTTGNARETGPEYHAASGEPTLNVSANEPEHLEGKNNQGTIPEYS